MPDVAAGMNPAEFANIDRCERELWWFQGMQAILLDRLDELARTRRVDRAIEIGCGTGHLSRLLIDRYGWSLISGDLSEAGLRFAQRKGLDRLACFDMRQPPFVPASFDLVLILDAIAHLRHEETPAAFAEFARLLRPGGMMVLRSSALEILRSRHSLFVGESQRLTASRLEELCRRFGFRIHCLTYLNSLLLPVALAKFRVWEPLTGAEPASGVAMPAPWLNSTLKVPLRIERALLNRGVRLPIGQSLLLIAELASQSAPRAGQGASREALR
jgi:SAM-dependent methyltransferase